VLSLTTLLFAVEVEWSLWILKICDSLES